MTGLPFDESEYNELLLQAVAVLLCGHNLLIMNKNLSDEQALFYAQETISKGWFRDMLLHAFNGSYYENLLATPVKQRG